MKVLCSNINFLPPQTDPDRRITVQRLLHHPWVMDGYSAPVDWSSRIDVSTNHISSYAGGSCVHFPSLQLNDIDMECIEELAYFYGKAVPEMRGEVTEV